MSEVNEALEHMGRAAEKLIGFNIIDPTVFFGTLVGAAIPAVFSAMLILGVDKNAQRMIAEIHRQFRDIKGLREGAPGIEPEYNKCIDIATTGALKELIPAGLMAIIATVLVGMIGGVKLSVVSCWATSSQAYCWRCLCQTPAACGTMPRNTLKPATRAAKALNRTKPPSSATP